MQEKGKRQGVVAQVPMAEMLEYASTLKAITSDRGSYLVELDHYDEVPAQVREKIVAEAAQAKEEKAG